MNIDLVRKVCNRIARQVSPIFCAWKIRSRKNVKIIQFTILKDFWHEPRFARLTLETAEALGSDDGTLNRISVRLRNQFIREHGEFDLLFPEIDLFITSTNELCDTMVLSGRPNLLDFLLHKYLDLVKTNWMCDPQLNAAYLECLSAISRESKLCFILSDKNQMMSFAELYKSCCMGEFKNAY